MIYTLFSVIRQNTRTRMLNHVTLAVATTTQKATFTVHEISVNVNMRFQSLNNMISAIRKIQFGLPKSGNTKVVPRKTVYRHAHVDHQQGLGTLFSVIRQTPK